MDMESRLVLARLRAMTHMRVLRPADTVFVFYDG
jgi:hypothetical protein